MCTRICSYGYNHGSEVYHFEILTQFVQVLMVLPHSNIDPERFFSMVRKIETEEIQ